MYSSKYTILILLEIDISSVYTCTYSYAIFCHIDTLKLYSLTMTLALSSTLYNQLALVSFSYFFSNSSENIDSIRQLRFFYTITWFPFVEKVSMWNCLWVGHVEVSLRDREKGNLIWIRLTNAYFEYGIIWIIICQVVYPLPVHNSITSTLIQTHGFYSISTNDSSLEYSLWPIFMFLSLPLDIYMFIFLST